MRENHSATQVIKHPTVLSSADEIAHGIETLRHLIGQIKELKSEGLQCGTAGDGTKSDREGGRVPDEVFRFHARKQIVMTERQVRQAIGEIFGQSSPEIRKYQHLRLTQTTDGIEETVAALESLIFQLEEKRLQLNAARRLHAPQDVDIDPLTDLYNRRLLDRFMAHELDRSQRYGYPCSLVFFALTNWKTIHAVHGGHLSNTVLVSMACACKASLRGYDYACRIADDQFAVLLPQSDSQGARAVSRRIAERFDQAIKRLSPGLALSLEFGTATFPFDGENATGLFHTAMTHRMRFTEDMSQIKIPAEWRTTIIGASF